MFQFCRKAEPRKESLKNIENYVNPQIKKSK